MRCYLFLKNVVARVTRFNMQLFLTGSSTFPWLLVGYSLVTRCLLVGYLLIELFMRYPIKKDTDLGKNTDVIV